MSYVTLHTNYPPMSGLGDAYSDCTARNVQKNREYQNALAVWKQDSVRFSVYKAELAEWNKAVVQRGQYQLQLSRQFLQATQEYLAAKKAWDEKVAVYQRDLIWNNARDAEQAAARRQVELKYNIKLPADCIGSAQKADMKRMCDQSSVRGLGYVFRMGEFPACALAELPTCTPRRVLVAPGHEPRPPAKDPPLPPRPPAPETVKDPGPAPPSPRLEVCTKGGAGAVRTFGLLAILAVGGGVLGYRAWRKHKRKG